MGEGERGGRKEGDKKREEGEEPCCPVSYIISGEGTASYD